MRGKAASRNGCGHRGGRIFFKKIKKKNIKVNQLRFNLTVGIKLQLIHFKNGFEEKYSNCQKLFSFLRVAQALLFHQKIQLFYQKYYNCMQCTG